MLIFQSSSIVILMFIWLRSCKIANHLRKKQNQASSTVETTKEHLPTYPCDKMHFLNNTWWWHGVQDAWYTDGCTPCSVLPTAQARKRSVFTTWSNLPQIFPARALLNLSLEKCFWWWPSTCRFLFFQQRKLACYFVSLLLRRRKWRIQNKTRKWRNTSSFKSTSKMTIHFPTFLDSWKKFSSPADNSKFLFGSKCTRPRK